MPFNIRKSWLCLSHQKFEPVALAQKTLMLLNTQHMSYLFPHLMSHLPFLLLIVNK